MKSNLNSVFKLLTILCCAGALVACSGVKRFTVEEFVQATERVCKLPQSNANFNTMFGAFGITSANRETVKEAIEQIGEIAKTANKTGCSVSVTPVRCSFSCGGEDTPIPPAESEEQKKPASS